jgi:hypothetical protein
MSVGNSKGPYLRVRTPITSDGVSLVTENEQIKYREDHLPLSAQKMLEKKNEKLPTSLRKKIEVVSDDTRPFIKPSQKVEKVEIENDLPEYFEDEQDEIEQPVKVQPAKKKGGRPAKAKASTND